MADVDIVRIDKGESTFDLLGSMPDTALRLLRDAIDDIADQIEAQALRNVPVDTGDLKSNPFTRDDAKRRVRGPGGLVVRTRFSINERGKQKWVHDGTGIFGPTNRPITPRKAPFMVFDYQGRHFRLRSVLGQRPQPYLEDAFDTIERRYIPARLAELRVELEKFL